VDETLENDDALDRYEAASWKLEDGLWADMIL